MYSVGPGAADRGPSSADSPAASAMSRVANPPGFLPKAGMLRMQKRAGLLVPMGRLLHAYGRGRRPRAYSQANLLAATLGTGTPRAPAEEDDFLGLEPAAEENRESGEQAG